MHLNIGLFFCEEHYCDWHSKCVNRCNTMSLDGLCALNSEYLMLPKLWYDQGIPARVKARSKWQCIRGQHFVFHVYHPWGHPLQFSQLQDGNCRSKGLSIEVYNHGEKQAREKCSVALLSQLEGTYQQWMWRAMWVGSSQFLLSGP